MHNALTEYRQMHNKTISWNDNWILILICFVGRILLEPSGSSSSSFIISYPNANMDKSFFKSWVLRIPHCLRDILWMVRAWSSIAPIFSSLIMSWASSSSQSLLKVITSFWHTFLEWMNPMIIRGHSRWLSQLLHSPLLLLLLQVCSLIWETLVKYDCMASTFWIFTFFNCFLKVIFWFMFFPSNSLVKESNHLFRCL